MTDLGTLGGSSQANGINASGQVVGWAETARGARHAFLYTGSTMTDLGTLGGTISEASGINASGQVVGWSFTTGNASRHAFLYTGSTMTDLGTITGPITEANDINDSGQIVGDSGGHAFLYSGSTMTDLGDNSAALGINASGQIVGYSGGHAFLYSGSTMTDLNTLIDPASGWWLDIAYDINTLGQIVGSGRINGTTHAFLLTPIPEPSTLALLLTASLGGLLWWRRR